MFKHSLKRPKYTSGLIYNVQYMLLCFQGRLSGTVIRKHKFAQNYRRNTLRYR